MDMRQAIKGQLVEKRTSIRIRGAQDITLSSPKGTMAMVFRDGGLFARTGKELRLKAGVLAQVAEAVEAYRPPTYEVQEDAVAAWAKRYGNSERAFRAGDEAAGFVLQRAEISADEPRITDVGTGEIVVHIGREDLA